MEHSYLKIQKILHLIYKSLIFSNPRSHMYGIEKQNCITYPLPINNRAIISPAKNAEKSKNDSLHREYRQT